MELPFLKNKNQSGGGGPILEIKAAPTHDRGAMNDDQEMLSQVWDELFQSFDTKNKKLGMEALTALVLHIQEEDHEQDQEEMPS